MFSDYSDVMTVEDVASALRIGKNSVYALLQSHAIGSRRIGRKYLIPKSCVIDYVQSARYTVVADESELSERRRK